VEARPCHAVTSYCRPDVVSAYRNFRLRLRSFAASSTPRSQERAGVREMQRDWRPSTWSRPPVILYHASAAGRSRARSRDRTGLGHLNAAYQECLRRGARKYALSGCLWPDCGRQRSGAVRAGDPARHLKHHTVIGEGSRTAGLSRSAYTAHGVLSLGAPGDERAEGSENRRRPTE
jgi:hypothetical protein